MTRARRDLEPQRRDVEELFVCEASRQEGLSSVEARLRLEHDGPNGLSAAKGKPLVFRFCKHLFDRFALLLWTGSLLAFLGERFSPGEGMILIAIALALVVVLNASFSFWQELRVDKAMSGFANMLAPHARVRREGVERDIEASGIVSGDVLILRKGDKVPADGRLFKCQGLKVDNSILTGESEPQLRTIRSVTSERLSARNLVFSGTLVTSGAGEALVYATGDATEIGQIAGVTRSISRVESPIRRELEHFVRVISAIAIVLGVLFFVAGYALGNPFWTNLVFAVGIIVANVPEGLLPTVTLALALSGRRMAKRNALLKTLESAETLGSTTVVCTDKTGTLTQNRMTVTDLDLLAFDGDATAIVARQRQDASCVMALCNNATLEGEGSSCKMHGDPIETALLRHLEKSDAGCVGRLRSSHERLFERPFDSVSKEMATVVRDSGGEVSILLKGAPERVVEQCSMRWQGEAMTPLGKSGSHEILLETKRYAQQGRRVLALAKKALDGEPAGEERDEFLKSACLGGGYSLVGLVVMHDPPRLEAREAVARCRQAGIRVIVVSGDHPETVEALSREIGIVEDAAACEQSLSKAWPELHPLSPIEDKAACLTLTGDELGTMSDAALRHVLGTDGLLFARTSPLDKLRIVEALQAMGEVVAVTGDGVNDAPALKRADVGVAMGKSGTDVAREAADVVLFDDNFASIVAAIEEGRVIYANIRRFIGYVLTSNVPEIVPYILFVLAGIPLPLPILLVLAIDLGTDLAPAIALASEPAEADVMSMKPRSRKERLLSVGLLARSYLGWGMFETLAGLSAYLMVLYGGGWDWGETLAPGDPLYRSSITAYFAAIVICQVANVLNWRTREESLFRRGFSSNLYVLGGILVELLLLAVIVLLEVGHGIFGTATLETSIWLVIMPFAIVMLALSEGAKALLRFRHRGAHSVEVGLALR